MIKCFTVISMTTDSVIIHVLNNDVYIFLLSEIFIYLKFLQYIPLQKLKICTLIVISFVFFDVVKNTVQKNILIVQMCFSGIYFIFCLVDNDPVA